MNPVHFTRLICGVSLFCSTIAVTAADSSILAPGAKPEKITSDYQFTEGPATDKQGNVFFTDQPNDRIVKWSTDGKFSDWMKPAGRSNGIYFDKDGNLVTCADEKNELWSISPDKKVTVLVKNFDGKQLNGPNDLVIRPDGNIYFTDPLYPRDYWKTRGKAMEQPGQYVYFLDRKSGALRPVEKELKQPNGIALTPDGKMLYVADLGARKTYTYEVAANGDLTGKKLFNSMGSDGMTLDSEGNLYETGRGVTVFNPKGEKIEEIAIPEQWTGNVVFGGKDGKTLFITASKSVYTVAMKVSGSSKRAK
jgi:gluconolactonase